MVSEAFAFKIVPKPAARTSAQQVPQEYCPGLEADFWIILGEADSPNRLLLTTICGLAITR